MLIGGIDSHIPFLGLIVRYKIYEFQFTNKLGLREGALQKCNRSVKLVRVYCWSTGRRHRLNNYQFDL